MREIKRDTYLTQFLMIDGAWSKLYARDHDMYHSKSHGTAARKIDGML
jgi:hypothetical protein